MDKICFECGYRWTSGTPHSSERCPVPDCDGIVEPVTQAKKKAPDIIARDQWVDRIDR